MGTWRTWGLDFHQSPWRHVFFGFNFHVHGDFHPKTTQPFSKFDRWLVQVPVLMTCARNRGEDALVTIHWDHPREVGGYYIPQPSTIYIQVVLGYPNVEMLESIESPISLGKSSIIICTHTFYFCHYTFLIFKRCFFSTADLFRRCHNEAYRMKRWALPRIETWHFFFLMAKVETSVGFIDFGIPKSPWLFQNQVIVIHDLDDMALWGYPHDFGNLHITPRSSKNQWETTHPKMEIKWW